MKKIAIVIPAYKTRFLRKTLASVASQTNQDFKVYVGDDASPENIEELVDDFKGCLNIVYRRFETNMGSKDLTSHWERCIRLSEEPMVWLFSDDDVMPPDGVERILAAMQKWGEKKVLFRFPLAVIDAQDRLMHENPPVEEETSGYSFLLDKLNGRISSAACEYVFSRDVWQEGGGFVKFPLAWCSDDATWAGFAGYVGKMMALPGKPVLWRNAEGENISNSTCFDGEKLRATALFVRWIKEHYPSHRRDADLHKALGAYLHTILCASVRGRYSLCELCKLCGVLWSISPKEALKVAFRHVRKAKIYMAR